MRRAKLVFSVALALVFLAVAGGQAEAQSQLTWNGTPGASWTTGTTNWLGASGSLPWDSTSGPSSIAVVTATGSASVSGTVFANRLNFASGTGTFSVGGGTLAFAGAAPTVATTSTNQVISLFSSLSGSSGLSLVGSGTTILSGNNTALTGTYSIGTGTFADGSGVVLLSNANAVAGATSVSLIATGAGNGNRGQVLQLGNGTTITGKSLVVTQSGTNRAALLVASGGTAAWNGDITISPLANQRAYLWADGMLTIGTGTNTVVTSTTSDQFAIRGTGTGTINSTIGSRFFKTDTGTWFITSTNNSFTGNINIGSGMLSIPNIANVGTNSSIGSAGTIVLQGPSGAATIQFTGSQGGSTNRPFQLAGGSTVDGGTIENAVAGQTLTLAGNVTTADANPASFRLGGVGNGVFAGFITGAVPVSVTKLGSGTWTISGSNAYTGGTTLSAGQLNINNASALGTGTFTISTTGTIDNTSSGAITLTRNNAQAWNSDFTFAGTNPLNLGTGAVTLSANRQVTVTSSTLTVDGGIGGAFALTKAGAGTLLLSNTSSSFGGPLTVRQGTLSIASINSASSNGVLGNSVTAVTLGDAGGLTGTLEYTGATASSNKPFTAATGGTAAFTVTQGATTLTLSGLVDGAGAKSFGGPGSVVLSGGLAGAGNLFKTGTGALTLAGAGHAGNFTISAGQLNLNQNNALGGPGGTLFLADVTLDNTSGGAVGINTAKAITLTGTSLRFLGSSALDLGNGTVTLSGRTAIDVVASTLTLRGDVTGGAFDLVKSGAGTLELGGLSGAASYSGNTDVSAGRLFLSGTSQFSPGTRIDVRDGATLQVGSSASVSGANVVLGATGVLITDSSAVVNANILYDATRTLTGNSEFNGVQTIASGVVLSMTADYLGTIPGAATSDRIVLRDGATLRATATMAINQNKGILLESGTAEFASHAGTGGSLSLPSVISGSGALLKTGTTGLRLFQVTGSNTVISSSNTYTGGTIVRQGTLAIVEDANLGAVAGGVRLEGGTLVAGQGSTNVVIDSARAITLAGGTQSGIDVNSQSQMRYDGSIGESGGAAGLRVGTAAAREGLLVLGGSNAYTGATTIAGGTLQVGAGGTAGSIRSTSAVTVNTGATLAFNRTDGYGGAFDKAIGGAGTLRVLSGSLTLSAVNTHSGAAIIAEGARLTLAAGATLPSSQIRVGTTLGSSATFDVSSLAAPLTLASGQKLGGYGTIVGDVIVGSGAVISPGGSIGNLTQTGAQTWAGGGSYQFEVFNAGGTAGSGWDLLAVDGLVITATGQNLFTIDLDSLANSTDDIAGTLQPGNWDPDANYQWKFLVANNTTFSESNFSPSWFTVNASTFESLNSTNGGFSVARGGAGGLGGTTAANELYIVYAAVPEPGTAVLALVGIAGAAAWSMRRRRRQEETAT